jgi:hypothetical protein
MEFFWIAALGLLVLWIIEMVFFLVSYRLNRSS